MSYHFGVGDLFAIPTHLVDGTAIAVPTPIQFGTMQEVGLDMSFDTKQLYGAKQFPVALGRGKGKITGKAKIASIDGKVLSDLIFGQAASAGIKGVISNFSAVIPSTPYTVTVTPPSSGTFVADLGVIDAATGVALTRVASAPATGQYSLAGAVYTFAAADTGDTVLISYEYSATSTTAKYGTISNQLMGYAPFFSIALSNTYAGKSTMLKFNRCHASKFSFPFKNEDFAVPDFEFEAFADDAGNIGYWAQK